MATAIDSIQRSTQKGEQLPITVLGMPAYMASFPTYIMARFAKTTEEANAFKSVIGIAKIIFELPTNRVWRNLSGSTWTLDVATMSSVIPANTIITDPISLKLFFKHTNGQYSEITTNTI